MKSTALNARDHHGVARTPARPTAKNLSTGRTPCGCPTKLCTMRNGKSGSTSKTARLRLQKVVLLNHKMSNKMQTHKKMLSLSVFCSTATTSVGGLPLLPPYLSQNNHLLGPPCRRSHPANFLHGQSQVLPGHGLVLLPRFKMALHPGESAPDKADFRVRLEEIVADHGEGVNGFALASGINNTTLRSYLGQGGPEPSRTKLLGLARVTGVSLDWLLAGRGPKFHSDKPVLPDVPVQSTDDLPHGEYVRPPFYAAVRASAGPGASIGNELSERPFAIRTDWLRRELATAPGNLALLNVDGDSMEPTLRRGDMIFLDHGDATPRDGIFVFYRDDHLHVKRLQFRNTRSVRVISDNSRHYPPYDLEWGEQEAPSLRVIGRIIGVAHKI